MYIWQNKKWPDFYWDELKIAYKLSEVKYLEGKLSGMTENLGLDLKNSTALESMTSDIITSSEIEGVILNADEVRSSIAWQLGIEKIALPSSDRYIEGVVEVMMDAVNHYNNILTEKRLFAWHTSLFPSKNILGPITIGKWRCSSEIMQVVSGRYGKETVHYEAPPSDMIPQMMSDFLKWLNDDNNIELIIKSAVAHLWFVSIHPFSDGNGRLARTITDMLLAKADKSSCRLYSMSAQFAKNRKQYYNLLETTQKGNLDITEWLLWFLECIKAAIEESISIINRVINKSIFWENNRHIAMNERQNKMVNLLWDGFEGKLTSSKWAKINKCSPDTALRDIQDLINKNILVKSDAGGRSSSYELK